MNNLKNDIISGLIWRFLERCGAQGISLVVSIILARLLAPSEFGMIALVTAITNILRVFAESGLGQGLVQKKDLEEGDFSTALIGNIGIAGFLYVGIFFASPWIAKFYDIPELNLVIRVLAINVLIGGVKGILQAEIQRNMQFKRFFWATIIGTIVSAFVGIFMAINHMGVWALVFQQLSNITIDTIILWYALRCKIKAVFSLESLKKLYAYSWKIVVSHLFDQIYVNIYSLAIGKIYTGEDLSYYNKGEGFPHYIASNLNSSIQMVMFPAFSSLQDNKKNIKGLVKKSIKMSTFIVFPMMAGLAAVSEEFISIFLTDKWLPCVPYLKFCCFLYALNPVHIFNLEAIKAIGRSDIYLKLELEKKVIGSLIFLATLPYGLSVMMLGRCLCGICAVFINIHPNKRLLDYGLKEQLVDLAIPFSLSFAMMLCIMMLSNLLSLNLYIKFFVEIFLGIIIYLLGAMIFRVKILDEIFGLVGGMWKKQK